MKKPTACLFAALLLAPALALSQGTTEVIHGVTVADPFRGLEDAQSPQTQAFFQDQDARARAALAAIPGRAALLERIRELSRSGTTITTVKLEANRLFYLRRRGDEPNPSLCMRDGLAGPERVLVDPAAAGGAIDWYSPSPDGRHVAYGLSQGGSEDSTLRVLAVDTGRDGG